MTATLTDLPDDLLLLIATFLRTVDLIRLEWTCTELRRLLFPQQQQQQQQQHGGDSSGGGGIAYRTILQDTEFRIPYFPDIYSGPADNDHTSNDAPGGVRDHRRLCHRVASLQHHMSRQGSTSVEGAPSTRMRVHLRGLSRAGKTLTALRWESLGLDPAPSGTSSPDHREPIDEHTLLTYNETVDFRMAFVRVALPHALTPARDQDLDRDHNSSSSSSSIHSVQILDHTGNVESAAGASSSPLAAAMFNTPGMVTGFAIVFDLTDMRSLLSCAHWIRDMRASVAMPVMTAPHFTASSDATAPPSRQGDTTSRNAPPLLLIGNKLDMYDPAQHSHILHAATRLARDNRCPLILQSARNNINCRLSMELLLACMTRVEGVEWVTHSSSSGPPAAVTQAWWQSSIRLLQDSGRQDVQQT